MPLYKKTFDTPFEQYAEHHGKEFTVVAGPLDGSDGTTVITLDEMRAQLEACGDQPTFAIRLSTGELISAFPEEVLAEYEWEFNPNSPPGATFGRFCSQRCMDEEVENGDGDE